MQTQQEAEQRALRRRATRRSVTEALEALGLRRLELYAHPDDWPQIKTLAATLRRKREKAAGK